MSKEYILCAAIWHKKLNFDSTYLPKNLEAGTVVCGYRHDRCIMQLHEMGAEMKDKLMVQGFLTSNERFVDRYAAGRIAEAAHQWEGNGMLFSEDLY